MAADKYIQAAASLGSGLLGFIGARGREKRQHGYNKEYMDIQNKYNQQMMEQAKQNQMDMWNDTNYGAQVKHMKDAGLNVGLMYGIGGGGGATTGGGEMGSTGMPSAPNVDTVGSGIQGALAAAQIANIKAQTKKTEAEATKIGGVDTENTIASTLNLKQGIENAKAQEKLTNAQTTLTEIESEIRDATTPIEIQRIHWAGRKALNDLQQAENETYISNETYKEKVKQIEIATIRLGLENMLIGAQTTLASAQAGQAQSATSVNRQEVLNKIQERVLNMSRDEQNWQHLSNEQRQNELRKEANEIQQQLVNTLGVKVGTETIIEVLKLGNPFKKVGKIGF